MNNRQFSAYIFGGGNGAAGTGRRSAGPAKAATSAACERFGGIDACFTGRQIDDRAHARHHTSDGASRETSAQQMVTKPVRFSARDLQDRHITADLDQIRDGTVRGAFEGRSFVGALETLVGGRSLQERRRRSSIIDGVEKPAMASGDRRRCLPGRSTLSARKKHQ